MPDRHAARRFGRCPSCPRSRPSARGSRPCSRGGGSSAVEILDARLTRPFDPASVAAELEGERVAAVGASRQVSDCSVRQSGRALLDPPPDDGVAASRARGQLAADPHARAVVSLDDGSDVAYRDVRRFGTWLLLEPDEARAVPRGAPRARAARPAASRRAPRAAAAGPAGAAEGGAPRPAHGRRPREHLRRRGALARAPPPAAPGGRARRRGGRTRCTAGIRSALAAGDRAAGLDAPRLRAARRRRRARCRTSSRSTGAAASRATAAARRSTKIRVGGRGTWYCPRCQPRAADRVRRPRSARLATGPWPAAPTRPRRSCSARSASREADRILHLYTLERGRIGAIAKGVRKTKSRFGARLEPLSHVELMLHQGRGELQTVTGVELVRSAPCGARGPYRLCVGLIGAEAMLRLFSEQEANERAFGR